MGGLPEELRRAVAKLGLTKSQRRELAGAWARAEESYRLFHWGERPTKVETVFVPPVGPEVPLYRLGELVSVTYETTKGGDEYHWAHDFAPFRPSARPILCAVPEGPRGKTSGGLVIAGGRYTVEERGIVG